MKNKKENVKIEDEKIDNISPLNEENLNDTFKENPIDDNTENESLLDQDNSVVVDDKIDNQQGVENSIIKIGKETAQAKKMNKFDVFWLKVWAVICAFVNQVSIYINKGIKFIFRKPAPLKYVKAVVASLLILLMIIILTAPFKITVNKKEELNIYSSGLISVQQQIGTDSETNLPIYKYGYADKKGKIKIDCVFDGAMPFKYGVAWVLVKDKKDGVETSYWKLINKKGKQIGSKTIMQLPYQMPVSQFGDTVKYASIFVGGKYGFITTKGKEVIECKYDEVGNFDFKLARVRIGNEYYFINSKGKRVSEKFQDARDFKEGMAAVSKNGLWSFINEEGNLLLEFDYDEVSDFKQGYALVKRGSTYGIIDIKGNPVVKTGVFTDIELKNFFDMK